MHSWRYYVIAIVGSIIWFFLVLVSVVYCQITAKCMALGWIFPWELGWLEGRLPPTLWWVIIGVIFNCLSVFAVFKVRRIRKR